MSSTASNPPALAARASSSCPPRAPLTRKRKRRARAFWLGVVQRGRVERCAANWVNRDAQARRGGLDLGGAVLLRRNGGDRRTVARDGCPQRQRRLPSAPFSSCPGTPPTALSVSSRLVVRREVCVRTGRAVEWLQWPQGGMAPMTSRPSTPRTHTILTPAASARSNSSCSPSLAFRV